MIYLDYNATAPYSDSVLKYINENFANDWANPSSEHDLGFELMNKIKSSRGKISDYLGVSSRTIFFTSGATESINTVLSIDNLRSHEIETIISSRLEHHATLDTLKKLEKKGIRIIWLENNELGQVSTIKLEEYLKLYKKTLVTLLYVNNETGVITNISEVSKICKQNDALLHIDAVQALGKLKFNLEELDVDFASFAGHKIGSFKGIGLLYIRNPKNVPPLMTGGGQESGFRPGTYNYSAIKSLELAIGDITEQKILNINMLREEFEKLIRDETNFKINCEDSPRVSNTTNIFLGGYDSRAVLLNLSRKDIMVSTGSACSSGNFEPSHVIKGLGYSKEYAASCLRISIGNKTSINDLKNAINQIKQIIYS